jgi:hypothetical protein
VTAQIDPAEALVLDAAASRGDRALLQATRRWRDEEWEGAEQELVQRGWLNPQGLITEVGIREREGLERATDALALRPWLELGEHGSARLFELLSPLHGLIVDGGAAFSTSARGGV